jgi:hypothetical protein
MSINIEKYILKNGRKSDFFNTLIADLQTIQNMVIHLILFTVV